MYLSINQPVKPQGVGATPELLHILGKMLMLISIPRGMLRPRMGGGLLWEGEREGPQGYF